MTSHNHIALLIDQLAALPHRDEDALDALLRRSEMVIRKTFGETSKYLNDLSRVDFSPMIYPADESSYDSSWYSGVAKLRNMFQTMLEEIELFGASTMDREPKSDVVESGAKSKVFVVHGHDDAAKVKVARFLEQLGLSAIILHERLDSGKTIIEKFEHEASSVEFAIVLLTADDIGNVRNSDLAPRVRARQNVVFELGYFVGALGRSNVVALRDPDVEMPSDYAGVIYVDLDANEAWRMRVAKEMKGAGIDIDMNRAI